MRLLMPSWQPLLNQAINQNKHRSRGQEGMNDSDKSFMPS
jgi:hypothetical protein